MNRRGEACLALGLTQASVAKLQRVTVTIRHAKPSDYGRVIGRVNVWWSGRDMAPALPKLFFLHFEGTSFVAEDGEGDLVGFLCGFLSQTK